MKNFFSQLFSAKSIEQAFTFLVVIALIVGYVEYRNRATVERFSSLEQNLASTTEALSMELNGLQSKTDSAISESVALTNAVATEQTKNATVQEQIGQIYNTASTLDKLSKTDKELLQKYSKVYFLNEHYVPKSLIPITPDYLYNKSAGLQILGDVAPFLNNMIRQARQDGIDLSVISAYRSFGTQAILKSSYKVTYGAGTANAFSADQGYSEHQLGTTVDLTTKTVADSFNGFDKTPAFTWMLDNAYKYGFIISYPQTNKYYEYEPWHWRFVGVDLATKLHREARYFYDLDQRVINDYLLTIFN